MHKITTAPALEPLGVPIPEAGRMLGCKRTSVYALAKEGELRIVKVRGRSTITLESIKGYHARLLAQQSQAA